MTPSTSTPERQPPDKLTLFCPACGHESRITGDWLVHVHPDSLVYECPACDTVIDSRRDQQALADASGGSLHFAAEN